MYFVIVVIFTLFYTDITEVKGHPKKSRGDVFTIADFPKEDEPLILGLLVMERNESSEELENSKEDQSFSYYKSHPKVWTAISKAIADTDSSGDSNSDEYVDSDVEMPSDTDIDSNYYHEEDYVINDILSFFLHSSEVLRDRWKGCRKAGSKACLEACTAASQNSCDEHDCKKKLRKQLKQECKRNCKDFFQ